MRRPVLMSLTALLTPAMLTAGEGAGGEPTAAPSAAVRAESDSAPGATDARVMPVTLGDAVIEPFWDANLEAWSRWEIAGDVRASAKQYWCMVILSWTG